MQHISSRVLWMSIIGFITVVGGPLYVVSRQNTVTVNVTDSKIKTCANSSLEEKVNFADVIVVATVDMIVPGEQYAEVFLQPTQTLKGELVRPQRVFANPTNPIFPRKEQQHQEVVINGERLSEISFATGQSPYLLFLRQTDGGYLTSRCDGSRLLGDGLTEAEKTALGVVQ